MAEMPVVTIPMREWARLLNDSQVLEALRDYGVDNWEGYDAALDSLEDEN